MSRPSDKSPIRVGLITLGCAKNLVDAEIILGHLVKDRFEITNNPLQADVVIVNTCSFIDTAQEESVNTILQSAEWRQAQNNQQGLIVSGCLPQRYREELPQLLPEVDVFMGIDQVAQVSDLVRQALTRRQQRLAAESRSTRHSSKTKPGPKSKTQAPPRSSPSKRNQLATPVESSSTPPKVEVHRQPSYIPDWATPRYRLTPKHFAYVKIAEGCNHPCSFCIIPRMRGRHRSRPLDDIMKEARRLVRAGVKELNLISQDSTYYGLDLRPNHRPNLAGPDRFQAATRALPVDTPTLPILLRKLNSIPGNFWIRLLYTHPAHWTEELIQTMAACSKVARYVDIPLQHIHPNMLQRMRRETSPQHIIDLIKRIREVLPGITLRTTFIVGFPGETNASFQTLLDFIRTTRFERLGVFTYSREEGTLAGGMKNQISDRIKRERHDQAMRLQRRIARSIAKSYVGRTLRVLVEQETPTQNRHHSWEHGLLRQATPTSRQLQGQYLVARSEADAPDIDGRVYVLGQRPRGTFAKVKIIGHTDYDLIAEP